MDLWGCQCARPGSSASGGQRRPLAVSTEGTAEDKAEGRDPDGADTNTKAVMPRGSRKCPPPRQGRECRGEGPPTGPRVLASRCPGLSQGGFTHSHTVVKPRCRLRVPIWGAKDTGV